MYFIYFIKASYILTLLNKYHFAQNSGVLYGQVAQILLTTLSIPINLHKTLDKKLTIFNSKNFFEKFSKNVLTKLKIDGILIKH